MITQAVIIEYGEFYEDVRATGKMINQEYLLIQRHISFHYLTKSTVLFLGIGYLVL